MKNTLQEVTPYLKHLLCDLSKTLGESICKDVFDDSLHVLKEYKDLNYIKILRPGKWIRERNTLPTSLLRGGTGLQEENSQRKINGSHIYWNS